MIKRSSYISQVIEYIETMPVCVILGPRQCGKTTLAREIARIYDKSVHFFDLENPDHLNELSSPKLALEPIEGLIVIDEIQRRPELFPYIRYLSDYTDKKFLILGSASRDLIHQSSETLAGRIAYVELTPFNVSETQESYNLWQKGGFPRSYLAPTDSQSQKWRKQYIFTFLERDLQSMGIQINPKLMRQFWMMIAHYHGNVANFAEIGRSLGVSHMTARRYLEILNDTFMIRICNRSPTPKSVTTIHQLK
ncbi:MAG: ATP-binding protein [Alphaproteobacteria bacterium]|nr:ATP-binding protein [Alphaproteobacteria bacterium]